MSLVTDAQAVLQTNWRGDHTVPSPTLYPHQWNWDSAFIAIGLASFAPERALEELESLVAGQWPSGLIPHILFSEHGDYAPGPEVWRTPTRTSSITQPPIAACALRLVCDSLPGGFSHRVANVAQALEKWHAWFLRTRVTEAAGGVAIVHPWESGMDNSPRWDQALARFDPDPEAAFPRRDTAHSDPEERPTDLEYARYGHLVRSVADAGFENVVQHSPFVVEDVAITAILCQADLALGELCQHLGVETRAKARHSHWAAALQNAASQDWGDVDLRGEHHSVPGVHQLIPLFSASITPSQARGLCRTMHQAFDAPWPLPTVPMGSPAYQPRRYWRGPVWVNTNWLVIRGLARHGLTDEAQHLAQQTLAMVEAGGFREHFHPETGQGQGATAFSWTAALVLDLIARPVDG